MVLWLLHGWCCGCFVGGVAVGVLNVRQPDEVSNGIEVATRSTDPDGLISAQLSHCHKPLSVVEVFTGISMIIITA